jgi:hypothetical protein
MLVCAQANSLHYSSRPSILASKDDVLTLYLRMMVNERKIVLTVNLSLWN